jgi:Inner membrane component of T3SS, cytoplasmic domain
VERDFVILAGPQVGEVLPLKDGTLVLGRGEQVDLCVTGEAVSRRHAEVEVSDGQCTVRDLGSINGVMVNGEPADQARLFHGDVVELGEVRLLFRGPNIRQPQGGAGAGEDDTLHMRRQESWVELVSPGHSSPRIDRAEEAQFTLQLLGILDLGALLSRKAEQELVREVLPVSLRCVLRADLCSYLTISGRPDSPKISANPELEGHELHLPKEVLEGLLGDGKDQDLSYAHWAEPLHVGVLVPLQSPRIQPLEALYLTRSSATGPFSAFELGVLHAVTVRLAGLGDGFGGDAPTRSFQL